MYGEPAIHHNLKKPCLAFIMFYGGTYKVGSNSREFTLACYQKLPLRELGPISWTNIGIGMPILMMEEFLMERQRS